MSTNTGEEEVLLDISPSPISVDDPDRKEVLWSERLEKSCWVWHDDCIERAQVHENEARLAKRWNNIMVTAAIVFPAIPIILLSSHIFPDTTKDPILNTCLVITSVLTGLNKCYDFADIKTENARFAGKFFRLATNIQKELSKSKRDRPAADVFLECITIKYTHMVQNAPIVPRQRL